MSASVPVVRVSANRRRRRFWRNTPFALDESVYRQDATNAVSLSGWVVHGKHRVRRVVLCIGSQVLAEGGLSVVRPRVKELFPSYPDAACAGFQLELPAPPVGTYQLQAELASGRRIELAEIELTRRTQPKLLFMHIPKAGGSTVNRFLAGHYAQGRYAIHIESNKHWKSDVNQIRKLDFVSGHVPLPMLARSLTLEDYFKITLLREPYAQLASHLAWVRRLADPGEEKRFGQHPEYIRRFARKLKATDLSSPDEVSVLFEALEEPERRLVENCQVRYFSGVEPGRPVNDEDLENALLASRQFDRIGTVGRIEEFLAHVADAMGWQGPRQVTRENVSRTYYGLDLGDTAMRAVMEPLVRYDEKLFRHVEPRAGSDARRLGKADRDRSTAD